MTKAAKNEGLLGNVTNHSLRKMCISRLLDAEVPVNYVTQLSGHKNLESLDSYKTASDEHQRKMSFVLSTGKKKAPIFSNSAPVQPAVKACELAIQTARKKASFFGRRVRLPRSEASRDASLIFHSTVHLTALEKTSISQSRKNATLLFQIILIQIKLKFPHDS